MSLSAAVTRQAAALVRRVEPYEKHIAFVAFAIWCAVTIATAARHEAWSDEADAWLVARDRSLREIWSLARYEGTPILWFLVQVPFAKLGLPFAFQEIVHWPAAAAAAALVLFRAPFSLVTRIAVAFSYFFVYEYVVVARGYALTVLFMFLVCALSDRRKSGSFALAGAITGAANATLFGLAFVGLWQVLALVDIVRDRGAASSRRVWAATVLGWVGTLFALVQLFPRPVDGQDGPIRVSARQLSWAFAQGEVPLGANAVSVGVGIACVVATLWLLLRSPRALILYVSFGSFLAFFVAGVRLGGVRHWGFFLVASIAARWMEQVERPGGDPRAMSARRRAIGRVISVAARVVLTAQLVAWCVRGGASIDCDLAHRFSNAEAMATYLRDQHLDDKQIAGNIATTTSSILPYFAHKELYYPGIDLVGTNMPWDRRVNAQSKMTNAAAVARTRSRFPGQGFLFLLSTPVDDEQQKALGLRFIHAEAEPACLGENFWLYGDQSP